MYARVRVCMCKRETLSAISALESSREFIAAAAEAVTKKSLTSSIESLILVDTSEFLTSSMMENE